MSSIAHAMLDAVSVESQGGRMVDGVVLATGATGGDAGTATVATVDVDSCFELPPHAPRSATTASTEVLVSDACMTDAS